MAILKVESEFNFEPIHKLIKIFPELNGRYLALIGKRSRTILRTKYLKGRNGGIMINPSNLPMGKSGKFLITSDVNAKRNQVKIYSFPLNLFERGRIVGRRKKSGLAGKKEAGRYIITRKLKQDVMGRIGRYADQFEGKVLNPELRKAGL